MSNVARSTIQLEATGNQALSDVRRRLHPSVAR